MPPARPVPPRDILRSARNPTLAFVRSLHRRDRRHQERAFVVEGWVAVRDALAAGATPRLLLVREGDVDGLTTLDALSPGLPVQVVAAPLFAALSDVETPAGVLAVFPMPVLPLPTAGNPLVLVADQVRDPGNLGTLLRAAAGAGVDAVYLTAASVDPFNPKVVRAGMGAHFRLPLRLLDEERRAELIARCPLRVIAAGEAALAYDQLDWRQPAAVIIGAEAAGVGPEGQALGTVSAAIPLAAGVESLNAGVAGAVFLFEAARQRRAAASGAPTAGPPGASGPIA